MQKKSSAKHLAIMLTVMMLFLAAGFATQEKKSFYIQADGRHFVVDVPSWQTGDKALELADIKLNANDSFTVLSGNIIEVVRAVPIIVFKDGKKQEIWTGQLTIEKALAKAGIDIAGLKIVPANNVRPSTGMNVFVLNQNEDIVEETREIPYKVITKNDSRMELGETMVMDEGVLGSKNVFVKLVALANGEMAKEDLVEKILSMPKEKVVAFGTTNVVATSRGEMRFTQVVQMEASAYTPWDEGCIGITKMGLKATHGVVAVDPDFIPLGTRLFIPGYGYAIAADIGGAIVGNRIDLCMENYDDAMKFGRRSVKVYILE